MDRRRRLGGMLAALATSLLLTTACEPGPPRPVLTVTTTDGGADAAPGDGLCKTVTGACSLQAAIEEGNALVRADLVVPNGTYPGLALSVTGDLRINWGTPRLVRLSGVTITIQEGAKLAVDGVMAQEAIDLLSAHALSMVVKGQLQLRHSFVWASGAPGLSIGPAGQVTLDGTVVASNLAAVSNAGALTALASTLWSTDASVALATIGSGSNLFQASAIISGHLFSPTPVGTCSGTPPVSAGYVHTEVGCGSAPATGDATGPSGTTWAIAFPFVYLGATSPLVDSIPLGSAGCVAGATDAYGRARAQDGNGDGIFACDIGGIERQP